MNELEKKEEALKLKRALIEKKCGIGHLVCGTIENRKRMQMLAEIGCLAKKAGIDHWNVATLLGAFLEIKEKEKTNSCRDLNKLSIGKSP